MSDGMKLFDILLKYLIKPLQQQEMQQNLSHTALHTRKLPGMDERKTSSAPWPDPPQLPDWDAVIVPEEAPTNGHYHLTAEFACVMQKIVLLGPEDDDDADMLKAYQEIHGTMSLAVYLHGFQLVNEILPEMVKSAQAAQDSAHKEAQLQTTLKAVVDSGLDVKGWLRLSLQSAAKQYDSHAAQQKLTLPQEKMMEEWIKVLRRRSVPLSLAAVTEHTSHVVGEEVLINWACSEEVTVHTGWKCNSVEDTDYTHTQHYTHKPSSSWGDIM
ncbi:hypothetical protein F5146DRAFT_1006948 [Armillaria mellea]|nr:hypothetical protein F5146DRAFT_1006948 [Armillaria mellea]